jgi:hypothetical protein
MTEETKSRPRRNKAKPSELIVEFKAPDTGHVYYIPIQVDSLPELERDDLGQLVRDENGEPKPVLRLNHSYIQVPRVHPAYDFEMNEEYKILFERAQAEREFAAKKPKPGILAELAA